MREKDFVPVNGSVSFVLNWLAGLLDACGSDSVDDWVYSLQLDSPDREFLTHTRLMLTRLGILATVVTNTLADTKKGVQKGTFKLVIGSTDTRRLIRLGLKTECLAISEKALRYYAGDGRPLVTVVSVTDLGSEDQTYCFDEPLQHLGTFNGIVTGQSEIILRSRQFCNLSEVVVRADDTEKTLARKVQYAAMLGTLQASLTNFRYITDEWRINTEEEALLGVSMTGIMDHAVLSDLHSKAMPAMLSRLRAQAVETNRKTAEKLGINAATAITCCKPSGTVSQLVDSASGIHSRYAEYYLRTVRADKKDPMSQLMRDAGFYVEDDVTKPNATDVFYFPIKSPAKAITRNERSAIEQLELWKIYQDSWCEHKPSITVYVREHEWIEVGAWVYKHFDSVSGVSFLPHNDSDTVYKQAPYQEVTAETFKEWEARMPVNVDWSRIGFYEGGRDQTTNTRDLACSAGVCEIL